MSSTITLTQDLTTRKGLNEATQVVYEALTKEAGRAQKRRLDAMDCKIALLDHNAAVLDADAKAGDVRVVTRCHGGFVPNSYGYTAYSDRIEIRTILATGETTVTVDRPRAQSRPHGDGAYQIVRIAKSNQITGRIHSRV